MLSTVLGVIALFMSGFYIRIAMKYDGAGYGTAGAIFLLGAIIALKG